MELREIKNLSERIKANIANVIVGKDEITELILVSLFCSGHVLLEDVPGLGKTVLAKCLAKSITCEFKRVQFTPDLLPSDLTGINYYNQKENEFIFKKGPIFTNILLADEINRATPRTQSSMLECMEERQVSIDGETRKLDGPFFVIATQNPIETQGTFPLPEAQLDRFFMRLKMGYPTKPEGRQILDRFQINDPFPEIGSVTSAKEIIDIQNSIFKVHINDAVKDYIMNIIEKTRNDERISLGVSPRGSLAVMRASQVLAVMRGRDFVTPDDVKGVAIQVLAHRIILKGRAIVSGLSRSAETTIADILNSIQVPVEQDD
jgi:MoxR-like ATPase